MNGRNAKVLLAAVIIVRASALLLSKTALRQLSPFNLMGVRFLLAFVLLAALFWKRLRGAGPRTLLRGALLGCCFFIVMSAELYGLRTTSSSTTSFLENTAIVMVPLMEAVLRRRLPGGRDLGGAAVTLLGVALLTLRSGGFHPARGEALCMIAAVFYSVTIILTNRLARRDDPLVLGIVQVGVVGALGMLAACVFEHPALPADGPTWGCVIALAVVCSGFGFTFQPVAQKYMSSEQAGMFCALSPLTAAVLGVLFLHERFGPVGLIGAACILAGICIGSIRPAVRAGASGKK